MEATAIRSTLPVGKRTRAWAFGAAYLTVGLGVYWLQHMTLPLGFYFILQAIYLGLLIPPLVRGKTDVLVCHSAMFFLVFFQYGADPYSETFVNLIDGPAKYVAIAAALYGLLGARWAAKALLILACLVVYALAVTLLNVDGIERYVANDALTYGLLFVVFSYYATSRPPGDLLYGVLFRFVTLLPIAYVVVYAAGLTHTVAGSTYFFYGHLYGFLIVWSLFVAFLDHGARRWEQASVLLSLVVWVPVAQTEHILLAFLLFAYVAGHRLSMRSAILLILGIGATVYLARVAIPGSWMSLKLGQLMLLATFDLQSANSLGIRVAEFLNIVSGNSTLDTLLGNGLGATYRDRGYFAAFSLHDQTFPADQLNSGRYHLIHVALVKLYFNLGVLGVLAVSAAMLFRLRRCGAARPSFTVPIVFFFFLWHASIQASMFLTVFTIYVMSRQRSERWEAHGDFDSTESEDLAPAAATP